MIKQMTVPVLLVGALCFAGGPAWSDEGKHHKGKGHHEDPAAMAKEAKVTIDQAIKAATGKVPGTVIEAELEKEHDKLVWEVKVVGDDGKVSKICVDAAGGEVTDVREKHKDGHGKGYDKDHHDQDMKEKAH